MNELVLSIFPGIDLLGRAFEEEGYCVVRGPDPIWGGDIKTFWPPAGAFHGVIGGPPCQLFSQMSNVNPAISRKAINLIPEFERVVKAASPEWYLMENVTAAPTPRIEGYAGLTFRLNSRWLGMEQHRIRKFSYGIKGNKPIDLRHFIELSIMDNRQWAPTVCASGSTKPGAPKDELTRLKYHGWKTAESLRESLRLQGLEENFCDDMPFTLLGKHKVIGNGVPIPMGRAMARAIFNSKGE